MGAVTLDTSKPDLIFDLETGEARVAPPKLDQIVEGEEDAE
jgi:hypothetical protein